MASLRAGLTRSVSGRGVHVQVVPRPMDISESREILRLLSQFGEVEYFRSLRYDARPSPNAALAIFKDEHAAKHCILKSPIRFRMSRSNAVNEWNQGATVTSEATKAATHPCTGPSRLAATPRNPRQTGTLQGAFGLSQTRSLNTDSLPKPPREPPTYPFHLRGMPEPSPPRDAEEQDDEDYQIYQMYINPSKINFMERVEMGHYHGGFMNDWRSAANDDLRKRTPTKGVANLNWRMKTKSASTIRQEREAIRAQGRLGGLGEIYREAKQRASMAGKTEPVIHPDSLHTSGLG